MNNLTTIELHTDGMKFASGHYTIFSAEHREKLHGHNFTVYAAITAEINENGMAFDYDIYKEKLRALCRGLSGHFLLPGNSPYQTIEHTDDFVIVHFNKEKIPFPKNDVLILPVRNVTVEDLAIWFIEQLVQNPEEIKQFHIKKILVKVFSGPGQSGSATWEG